MQPDPYFLFEEFRSGIVGHEVRWRRLAGNSLIVYIDCEPGDDTGFVIWFEPTWNLRDSERVLTGSRQAQHDEDAEDPYSGFKQAGEAVDMLVGRRVTELLMEPVTGDLRLELDGGLSVRTFVSDPETDHLWHIHESASGTNLYREGRAWAASRG